jgi:hypothetical protein
MRRVRHCLAGILLIAAVSCVHSGTARGSDRRLITEEEILSTNATTAFDVIARLRAEYLRNRGPTSLVLPSRAEPVVFLNDQLYGSIGTLKEVRSSDLAEIRFYDGPDAITKFGSQYSGGVIQLVTRSRE